MEQVTSVYLDKEQMDKFELVKKVMQKFNPNVSNTDVWKEIIDFGLKSPKNEDILNKYRPNQKTKHSIRLGSEVDQLTQKTGLNKSDSLKYCLEMF